MVETNYRQSFKAAIARIYHTSGAIVGAGFLVSERYLLTCAHVVTAALGIPTETAEVPSLSLELDFPLIAPEQKIKAKVVFWQAVNPPQTGEDIAGLELESFPPVESESVRLVVTDEFWNHPFQIFGFPSQRDVGIWASGVLRDRLSNGWIQMEDIKAQGYAVQPGFSGAPVWDEQLQGVVGMAVAAEKKREEAKAAFMIPVSVLDSVWTALDQWVVQVGSKGASGSETAFDFRQVQLTEKRKYWSVLVEKWKAAHNQLSFVLNRADAVSLEQQLKTLEQDIIQVEQEIKNLGG
jgi:hypothetical protein